MNTKKKYQIEYVSLDELKPFENQPRKFIEPEQVERLAESIKKQDVLQPIKYTKKGGENIIVSGHLRYEAAKKAGVKEIPAIEIEEEAAPIIALIENIAQNPMLPLEEALAIEKVFKQTEIGQNKLAALLVMPKASMSDKLKLTKLPKYIQDKVLKDPKWPAKTLRMLASIKDEVKQREEFEKLQEKLEAKAEEKAKAERPSQPLAKWEQHLQRLNTASNKFKIDFENRVKKIVPEEEAGRYSERIEAIYTQIEALLKDIQADQSSKTNQSQVTIVSGTEEESAEKRD